LGQGMGNSNGDILVIKLKGLKSFVHCLPALRSLRQHHRGQRITLLTTDELFKLAEDSPYVDDVETLPPLDDKRTLKYLAQTIKREKFTRIYDLEGDPTTQRILNALKPFPPTWIGKQRAAKFRYQPAPGVNEASQPLELLAVADVETPSAITMPDTRWAANCRQDAPSLKPEYFGIQTPFVMFLLDGPRGAERYEWPASRFAGLAVTLAKAGIGVAVHSETDDRTGIHAVINACHTAIDLSVRADATQLAALATHAAAIIGHRDGGLTHLLAATGVPTIYLAKDHEDGLTHGPRGPGSVNVMVGKGEQPTIDYMSALLSMYAGVGNSAEREAEPVREAHPFA